MPHLSVFSNAALWEGFNYLSTDTHLPQGTSSGGTTGGGSGSTGGTVGNGGGGTYPATATPPATVGWDSADANSQIVFSDNDHSVVRDTTNSDWVSAASLPVSGKTYFEVKGMNGNTIVGIANETVDAVNGTLNFVAAGFWGVRSNGSQYGAGSITNAGVNGFAADAYRFWFDPAAGNLWVAFGDVMLGGGDPVAGTNPTFTGITGSTFRIMAHTREKTTPLQAFFSAQSWHYAPDQLGTATSTTGFEGADDSTDYYATPALPLLPTTPNKQVYLLWFAGQSNMQGGNGQENSGNGGGNLSTHDLRTINTVQRWIGTQYAPFTVADIFGAQQPHGPDVFLMQQERDLMFYNHPTYMVKTTVGGTPITQFLPGGSYNSQMEAEFKGAVNELIGRGYHVKPIMFWHQGESQDLDAYGDVQTSADNHQSNFAAFVSYARGLLNGSSTGTLPIVAGELWDRPTNMGDFHHITTVNNALHAVANSDAHLDIVPTKDLAVYDLVHFTSESQITFGQLLADKMRTMGNDCVITSTI